VVCVQREGGLFPPYFPALFVFMSRMVLPHLSSPDMRVRCLCDNYASLLHMCVGVCDPVGEAFFRHQSHTWRHLGSDDDIDGGDDCPTCVSLWLLGMCVRDVCGRGSDVV
jgi:hypothetical protein